jgi:hypothetical protein
MMRSKKLSKDKEPAVPHTQKNYKQENISYI